jgi:diguanylate cyclase (GGDEF)-like protein/PAS domain S-box-containing protein
MSKQLNNKLQSDCRTQPLLTKMPRVSDVLFQQSDQAIIITDASAKIISVNPAFTQLSGYEFDEVYGKNPNLLSSGLHTAEFYREMWDSLTTLGSWSGEIRDKRKTGEIYPKWLKIIAIKDEYNKVTHYLSMASDISERKKAEQNIEYFAYYDVLTGLPNRCLLYNRIEQQITIAQRDQQKFALVFIDLDRFKYVNDSMGHAVGDQLLQAVATRLLEQVREGDTVSRIGGDEFVILLRDTDDDGAAHVARNLLEKLSAPCKLNGVSISTSATIGISLFPENGLDTGTLVQHADVAMYRAKDEGRNRFRFFTNEMNSRIKRIFTLEKDLRLALERDEFVLFFQPQMDSASGRICGAEALIRWNHPETGRISPTEFIPVAEETGLIIPIGEWVLRTTCRKIAAWRQQGMQPFPVAINLSLRQLLQPNFAQLVTSMMTEYSLLPNELELEFTESIMLSEAQIALDFMIDMRNLGIRLSIDDFGTGYSSLSFLNKMPVHKLKIDQSFIREIQTDQNDGAIVRSIIDLGHHFNLSVIAEGVETPEQMDYVKSLGCDEIQGYLFSRPLPDDEFEKFVYERG